MKHFFIHPRSLILIVSLEKTHPSTKEKKLNLSVYWGNHNISIHEEHEDQFESGLKESNISTPQRNSIQVALHCC
jgi:hypothetical protein